MMIMGTEKTTNAEETQKAKNKRGECVQSWLHQILIK